MSLIVRLVLAVVLGFGLLALVYSQIRPSRRSSPTGLMMRSSGAITEVSLESARARILKAVSDVSDVISVEAQVKAVRGRADLDLQVTVLGGDVKLPNKQVEINRALKQVITKQLGLQMAGRPRVHIRLHGEEPARSPVISPAPSVPQMSKPPIAPPGSRAEPALVPAKMDALAEPVITRPEATALVVPPVDEPKLTALPATESPADDKLDFDLDTELGRLAVDDIVDAGDLGSETDESARPTTTQPPDASAR